MLRVLTFTIVKSLGEALLLMLDGNMAPKEFKLKNSSMDPLPPATTSVMQSSHAPHDRAHRSGENRALDSDKSVFCDQYQVGVE